MHSPKLCYAVCSVPQMILSSSRYNHSFQSVVAASCNCRCYWWVHWSWCSYGLLQRIVGICLAAKRKLINIPRFMQTTRIFFALIWVAGYGFVLSLHQCQIVYQYFLPVPWHHFLIFFQYQLFNDVFVTCKAFDYAFRRTPLSIRYRAPCLWPIGWNETYHNI